MGTPGLRLIQDLLAKSVAKWSGDTSVKESKDESNFDIKVETENIKVEYIETESIPLDVTQFKEENKVGSKRKLCKNETDKNRKKKRKEDKILKYGDCEINKEIVKKEANEGNRSDEDNKSLIKRLLENSAAKIEGDGDYSKNFGKIKNIKMKRNKKETNIKIESVDNLDIVRKDRVLVQGYDDKNIKLETHLLGNHGDGRYNVTEVEKETKSVREIDKIRKDFEKHKTKARTRKNNIQMRRFTPEEDEILQHAINTFGDNINFKTLGQQLGRDPSSVRTRVKKLKTGNSNNDHRQFSLVEDILIMDRMLEKLPGRRLCDLEMHVDSTTQAFLTNLGRTEHTATHRRWGVHLKPWILQHYAGTLNLDINSMLANFLVETFDNIDSIDWEMVVSRPEFSGHTVFSLKRVFLCRLLQNTYRYQKLERSEVTLRNIADHTNSEHGLRKKVTEGVLLRQKQVIDYFEQYVKKHGITDFL